MPDSDSRDDADTLFAKPGGDDNSTARIADGERQVAPPPSGVLTPGSRLLRYIILDLLGQGGMGRVYKAYDPRLGREVALKLLIPEIVDAEMSARLEREAQLLAKLSHPNVVTVFDVEALERELVVVMEFVPGQPLRRWLETSRPWRRVLEVFAAAGRGLAAAHDIGIVHRDFKPGNVLIGDDLRVRVLDFGLAQPAGDLLSGGASAGGSSSRRSTSAGSSSARSTSDPSTSKGTSGQSPSIGSSDSSESSLQDRSDRLTQTGLVLGTPRYMSPEQHCGLEIDARTDVYAFSVALWEGLAGAAPFERGAKSLSELLTAKQRGPGPWPAHVRVPARIVAALRRGLAFNRDERWPHMHALLAALEYDPQRRSTRLLLGGSVALSAALASAGAYAWFWQQSQRCEGAAAELEPSWNPERAAAVRRAFETAELPYAKDTLARVEARLGEYADEWVAMHTQACEAATIRGEESSSVLDLRMTCLQRARTRLDATVTLLEAGDPGIVERAVKLVVALPNLQTCADLEALRAEAAPPDDPEIARAVASVHEDLAATRSLLDAGRYADGLTSARTAAARARELDYPPVEAEAELLLADALEHVADFGAAEASARRALELAIEHGPLRIAASASVALTHLVGDRGARLDEAQWLGVVAQRLSARTDAEPLAAAYAAQALGNMLHRAGKYEEAEATYRRGLQSLPGDSDRSLLRSALLNNLSATLQSDGRYRDAIDAGTESLEIVTRVLGESHPSAADTRVNLANALAQSGDVEAALAHYQRSVAVYEIVLGAEHPNVAAVLDNIGLVERMQGHFDAAIEHQRRALAIREAALGPDHIAVATTVYNLGSTLKSQGQLEEAMELMLRALRIQRAALGEAHPSNAQALGVIGEIFSSRGEHERAAESLRQAIDLTVAALGEDHIDLAAHRTNLALVLEKMGRRDEAIEEFERALTLVEKAQGSDHIDYATILHNLGGALAEQRRFDAALGVLVEALEIRRRHDAPPEFIADTALGVAKLWWHDPSKRSDAEALVRSTRKNLDAAASTHATDVRRAVDEWLASPRSAQAEVAERARSR